VERVAQGGWRAGLRVGPPRKLVAKGDNGFVVSAVADEAAHATGMCSNHATQRKTGIEN
jgi:hypothetical protein